MARFLGRPPPCYQGDRRTRRSHLAAVQLLCRNDLPGQIPCDVRPPPRSQAVREGRSDVSITRQIAPPEGPQGRATGKDPPRGVSAPPAKWRGEEDGDERRGHPRPAGARAAGDGRLRPVDLAGVLTPARD